jgi:hypothetical protein
MKLSELELNTAQAAALYRILNREAKEEERRQELADYGLQQVALYNERYEKLTALAREWARKNGNIEGMPAYQMATATWETFTAGDGWYSEMDVDDRFSADEKDETWEESWTTAYMDELSRMDKPGFIRA